MNTPTADALDQVILGLQSLLSDTVLAGLPDHDRAVVLRRMGEVSRLSDAVVVEAVASADVDFGHRFGCRGMNELLQRALLTDASTAGKIMSAAAAVRRQVSLTSGERLPARWPMMREALLDGVVGVVGLLAAVNPVEAVHDRLRLEDILAADEILARFARGHRDDTDGADAAGADATDGADGTDGAEGSDGSGGAEGSGTDRSGPPATPGELRNAAQYLVTVLDQDGAAPKDECTALRRFVTIGPARDGLHKITGNLLPEVAAQLKLIFDAFNNPKVGGAPVPGVRFAPSDADDGAAPRADAGSGAGQTPGVNDGDGDDPGFLGDASGSHAERSFGESMPDSSRVEHRDAGQKRHDALAAALGIAARHDEMPKLGGAAPTVVVHVDAKDLAAGSGWARIPGAPGTDSGSTAFVPVSVATHTACTGAVQRVLMDEGRIIGISVTDRVFTVHQRRAIILRDTECLIPGCHVPASWCEIHHVTEHARGGPTHTDNGVPLCWWHHRSLDTSGWEIRMNTGVPEIRGPAWWDPTGRWWAPRPRLDLTRTG